MMTEANHLSAAELETGLPHIRLAPKDVGVLKLIVRRPATGERDVLPEGELTLADGLVGDSWKARGSSKTPDRSANPEMQITITNARLVSLLARDAARWPLAGDQLYVDLDLSIENLPPGTKLAIGSAVLQVSAPPHTGCSKFAARFGAEALKFVNSPEGKSLRLRGLNARIIQPGRIRAGDPVKKL